MRMHWLAASAVAAIAPIAFAQTPDPDLARNLAAGCTGCHGPQGISKGGIPSLAAQSRSELVRKMQDYKAGRAAGTIMPQLAKGYSDQEIDLMAGWFAASKP